MSLKFITLQQVLNDSTWNNLQLNTKILFKQDVGVEGFCRENSIGDCTEGKWQTKQKDNSFKTDPGLHFECGKYCFSTVELPNQ